MPIIETFPSPGTPLQSVVRMFDADCKNINRVPQNTAFHHRIGLLTPSLQYPVHPFIKDNNSKIQPGRYVEDRCVEDISTSTTSTRQKDLFQLDKMPLLYLTAMVAGLTVLGIFGAAMSIEQTLLSVALFQSVLIPVLVVHCILSIDNKYAVGLGLCTLVYTSVSVPFSLNYDTPLFVSISFAVVLVFHIVAGVPGWRCIPQLLILGFFTWICIYGFPLNPDRGDTISLIVLPGTQIILVCVSGILSTMSRLVSPRSILVLYETQTHECV
jgi:hypothetical protein